MLAACTRGLDLIDVHLGTLGATELRAQATAQGDDLARLALGHAARTGDAGRLLVWSERWRATALAVPPVRRGRRPGDDPGPRGAAGAGPAPGRRRSAGAVRRCGGSGGGWRRRYAGGRCTGRAPAPGAARRSGSPSCATCSGTRTWWSSPRSTGSCTRSSCPADRPARRCTTSAEPAPRSGRWPTRCSRCAGRAPAGAGRRSTSTRSGPGCSRPCWVRWSTSWTRPRRRRTDRQAARRPLGPAARRCGTARSRSRPPRRSGCAGSGPSPRHDGRVVLVGGPRLSTGAVEVRRLAERYPGAVVLADGDATSEQVLAAMDGAWLVHVAAHGTFRVRQPPAVRAGAGRRPADRLRPGAARPCSAPGGALELQLRGRGTLRGRRAARCRQRPDDARFRRRRRQRRTGRRPRHRPVHARRCTGRCRTCLSAGRSSRPARAVRDDPAARTAADSFIALGA